MAATMGGGMSESLFHTNARRFLVGPHLAVFPGINGPRFRRAAVGMGGLDHLAAELPLAFADDSPTFQCSTILTEQRLLARGMEGTVEVPYSHLDHVQVKVPKRERLALTAPPHIHPPLYPCPSAKPIAAFLQWLATLPAADRASPQGTLTVASPDDPTGAVAARAAVLSDDPRIPPILGMAHEGFLSGAVPVEGAADLVARAALLDRTFLFGRGMRQGWWLSPLAAPDLVHAMACLLGAPSGCGEDGEVLVCDFPFASGSDPTATSIIGGLALGALTGVVRLPSSSRVIMTIRLRVLPRDLGCGFSLFGGPQPLSVSSPGLTAALFEQLSAIEARLLLERSAFGWNLRPEQLDALPARDLRAKVSSMIGEVDLGYFLAGMR